jgi:hypothetical protein
MKFLFALLFLALPLQQTPPPPGIAPHAFYAMNAAGTFVPVSMDGSSHVLTVAGSGFSPGQNVQPPTGMYQSAIYALNPSGVYVPVSVDATGALIVTGGGGGGGGSASFPATTGVVCNVSTSTASTCATTDIQAAIGAGVYATPASVTAARSSVLLTDTTNGHTYSLTVINGALTVTQQ